MKHSIAYLLLGLAMTSHLQTKADDVVLTFKGKKVEVKNECKDSVNVTVEGSLVNINSRFKQYELTILMKGKGADNHVIVKTKDKAKITLGGLALTSNDGAVLWLKNNKRVKIVAKDGTKNELCVAAVPDTATMKSAVVFAKENVKFAGNGKLDLTAKANGCRGIISKKDVTIDDLTLNVVTLGDNLGRDERGFGGFGGFGGPEGGFPDFGGPMGEPGDSTRRGPGGFGGPMGGPGGGFGGPGGFNFDELPDSVKQQIEEMRKRFEQGGGFPGFGGPMGEPGDSTRRGPGGFGGPMGFPGGGFPGGEGGPEGGFGGGFGGFGGGQSGDPDDTVNAPFKQRYVNTTKGIKAAGHVTINSGVVYVKTSSPGAEGIEGKQGVTINGGEVTVDAVDDAINANAPIIFNGGTTIAEAHCNDAVDANYGSGQLGFGGPMGFGGQQDSQSQKDDKDLDPAIAINGGVVYAWSHNGAPEEGFDCDFSVLSVTGGIAFSLGGGMGEMPSVPTAQSAKQPTALFLSLNLTKGEMIKVLEGDKVIYELKAPMNYNNSATIFTHPLLKQGGTYKLVTKDSQRTFTFTEPFITVRK